MTDATGERRRSEAGGRMSVEQVERELGMLRMNEDGTIGLRSSVLNLIVVTNEEDAPEITRSISALADRYPSRVIVLISDPEGEANLDIQLSAYCSLRGGARQSVCSEQVTVYAEGEPALHLDSVAGPLLTPDLPTYLYYPGRFSTKSYEFSRLAALSDHLIVDTGGDPDIASAFRGVVGLMEDPEKPLVGDLQWGTLTPWRALVRDLFGTPERAEVARRIRRVEILHAPDGASRCGLLVGWICHVFGWKPVSATALDGGSEYVFDSGEGGEVVVFVSALDSEDLLSRITLEADDRSFEISRPKGMEEVRVTVRQSSGVVAESAARLGSFDASAMLGQALKHRSRDHIYENSLRRAVEVLSL